MEYLKTNNNKVNQAKELILKEYLAENGLQHQFKESSNVDENQIDEFISALETLAKHYKNEETIEKPMTSMLHSYYITLKESETHWDKRWPKGYNYNTLTNIYKGISTIFIN